MKKRLFDFVVCALAMPVWLPLVAVCGLAILLTEGRPVFYVSRRRNHRDRIVPIVKFRTMVRNADRVANRDTVPVEGVRFLNIPLDSPLYTRVGRVLERLTLTELPQLFQVLVGQMSLVGNRPLPENVVEALREEHPNVDDRFLVKGGMCGPVQLVGRDRLSDADRLMLETEYARACLEDYSIRMDFLILLYTVLLCTRIKKEPFTVPELRAWMRRYTRALEPLETAPIPEPALEGPGVFTDRRAPARREAR